MLDAKSYKEGAKAGLQEGSERVIKWLLEELDVAEQDKEMSQDPDDPKIRIKYLRDRLLKITILP